MTTVAPEAGHPPETSTRRARIALAADVLSLALPLAISVRRAPACARA
jgi:hypothetical protein